ncbi:Uncharacterised protein [Candidatus Burarchaeum australiense]|nr:Uncharacterised protein [Candidatus Burarchaeum australiense]
MKTDSPLFNFKADVLRYPRLDTVLMIEKALSKSDGTKTARQIWQKLPRKVMWQTFMTTLDYLEHSGKIQIDKDRTVSWIWNPRLLAYVRKRGVEA